MDIIKHFNLPKYVKGKSFSEASKFIAKKFEGRTSPEDLATLNDLQGRLQQAQEYIKQQNAKLSQPQGMDNSFNYGGKMGPGDKTSTPYPADPNELIKSFQSNQEAANYANPYPNRSNRWSLLDNYQKSIANKTMDTGNTTPGLKTNQAFNSGMNIDSPKLRSELEVEKASRDRVVPTIEEKLAADRKMVTNQVASNNYNIGGMLALAKEGQGQIEEGFQGAMGLANRAFGKTGIDTSGRTANQEVNMGSEILGGVSDGVKLGKNFGIAGMTAGAIGGGFVGLATGNKKGKQIAEGNFNEAVSTNRNLADRYFTGGPLGLDPDEGFDFQTENDKVMANESSGFPLATEQDKTSGLNLTAPTMPALTGRKKQIFDEAKKFSLNGTKPPESTDPKGEDEKFNPSELLRYAPAAMNAYQLATLEKPQDVAFDRLNTKYDKQLVDEQGLQNTVRQATASNRDALLSSAGGSGAKARAALLASQLQGTKALSQAYQQAGAENRQEGRAEQQFNLGVDKTNLQQGNLAKQVNLQRDAAYQSNRSKLLSSIGDNLGDVGREELYKRFPELMGLSYDYKGKKKKKKGTSTDS